MWFDPCHRFTPDTFFCRVPAFDRMLNVECKAAAALVSEVMEVTSVVICRSICCLSSGTQCLKKTQQKLHKNP